MTPSERERERERQGDKFCPKYLNDTNAEFFGSSPTAKEMQQNTPLRIEYDLKRLSSGE